MDDRDQVLASSAHALAHAARTMRNRWGTVEAQKHAAALEAAARKALAAVDDPPAAWRLREELSL